jgi:murein DD-endopeptidase MepM/ murein hydrolase activator NlpD
MRVSPIVLLLTLWWLSAGIIVPAQEDTPTATPEPRPVPSFTATDGRATLELYFAQLPQGGTGVARLVGEGVESARLRFLSVITDFYATDDGAYVLIPVGLDVTPRPYPLAVSVLYTDGTRGTIDAGVEVVNGNFLRQAFTIDGRLAYLTTPEVERNEYARIESLLANSSPQRLWSAAGFALPMDSEITSAFGSYRTLNQVTQTRHTGWDFRAATGTPVRASAGGQVAYAGPLDIRGNYVLIDHGFGVFSGYAHFSQTYVTTGQTVNQGEIIGVSGNTGRSNGPHLHWEIAVNGEWIDSVAFTEMWLP